ncbi:MAG: anthranilate synthase component I [Beijerinckiaceae bacterium]|nr:anthranilate synthase component I [Beijerinckiaceae bacterium]
MTIEPAFETFAAAYGEGVPQLVHASMVADLETPVSAYLKLKAAFAGHSFLLESVEGGATRGRYSMIGLEPDLVWRCQGATAYLREGEAGEEALSEAPLQALRTLLARSRIAVPPGLPPMAAGVFGYLGYDMVRLMERLPAPKPDPIGVPDAVLTRPTLMVVFDSVKDIVFFVAPVRPGPGVSARQAYEAATLKLERAIAAIEGPLEPAARVAHETASFPEPQSNTSEADYLAMVARAKDYVRAGDVFQVVLSQRFSSPFPLPPFSLYRALRRVNPAPFLCYLDFGGFQIVCSSPEILVRVRDGKVHIRPIAGTRPRGMTPSEDKAHADSLLADPKERAEHLMLLDLGRNDVGRVATIGSVAVTESFFLEYYSHVMHIVSHVTGTLDVKFDAIDALSAGFPAGTVSGAPKIRAMEIIDELETDKRGIYAGCIGYFGADGDMDTCIVLRTAVVKDGTMHVQAGAGIVHDSDPKSEYQECVNKAKALFSASHTAMRASLDAQRGQ